MRCRKRYRAGVGPRVRYRPVIVNDIGSVGKKSAKFWKWHQTSADKMSARHRAKSVKCRPDIVSDIWPTSSLWFSDIGLTSSLYRPYVGLVSLTTSGRHRAKVQTRSRPDMYCKLTCSVAHMLVDFNGDHNDHTDTPAALTKCDLAPETRAKLLDLFANGYGSAEAMAELRYTEFEMTEPSEYSTAFADRAILSSIYYVDTYDISLHYCLYGLVGLILWEPTRLHGKRNDIVMEYELHNSIYIFSDMSWTLLNILVKHTRICMFWRGNVIE